MICKQKRVVRSNTYYTVQAKVHFPIYLQPYLMSKICLQPISNIEILCYKFWQKIYFLSAFFLFDFLKKILTILYRVMNFSNISSCITHHKSRLCDLGQIYGENLAKFSISANFKNLVDREMNFSHAVVLHIISHICVIQARFMGK